MRAGRGRAAWLRAVVVGTAAAALLGAAQVTPASAAEPSWTAASTILSGGDPTSFSTVLSTDGTTGYAWAYDVPAGSTSIVRRTPAGWSAPYVVAGTKVRVGVSANGRTAMVAWPEYFEQNFYTVMVSMSTDGGPWSEPDGAGIMYSSVAPGIWVSGDGDKAVVTYPPSSPDTASWSVWTRSEDRWLTGGSGPTPAAVLALDETGASGLGLSLVRGVDDTFTVEAARWNGSGLGATQNLMPSGWVYNLNGGSVRGRISADGSRMVAAWDAVSTEPGSTETAVLVSVYENGAWGPAEKRGVSGARLSGSRDLSVITVGARDGGAGGASVVQRVNGVWGAPHLLPGGEAVSWLAVTASADGSTLLLTYSSAARGFRSQLRTGDVWGPEQVIDGQAGGAQQASALSGDGQHAIAVWRGSGCSPACVRTAALNPQTVPVADAGPSVTGVARVDTTATCAVTWAFADSSTRQWLRDGTAIPGATGATYRLTAGDLGRQLSCRVDATNTWGTTTRTSPARAVAPGVFAVVRAPRITGTPRVGKRLTARTGTWSPSASAYRFQWLNNGKAIKGATKSTYVVKRGDRKDRISVRVTATRTAYTAVGRTTAKLRIR
ncbi:MAG: hypothetical protein U0S36_04700 [Candidatus Nanopelagicales bacterium]